MLAAEKRKKEIEKLKEERINHILACSFFLFSKNGIECMTMNEIASNSEIGVASLYRYFVTKEDLSIQVAIHAWNTMEKKFEDVFTSEEYKKMTGIKQLETLLGVFPAAFKECPEFFKFIYFFDSFMKKESIDQSRLTAYEEKITFVKAIVIQALNKGLEDKTIDFSSLISSETGVGENVDKVCTAVLHGLFSTAQKLSLSQGLLAMDEKIQPYEELILLVKLFVDELSAR